jgi:hypothetical protein
LSCPWRRQSLSDQRGFTDATGATALMIAKANGTIAITTVIAATAGTA